MTYRALPAWDDYFMNIAWVVSRRATCLCRPVGALIVLDQRIISTGYTEAPFGAKNCNEGGCVACASGAFCQQGYQFCICLHAEQNAISLAARYGVMANYATLYTTLRPCLDCIKIAIQAGIRQIVFDLSRDFNNQSEEMYQTLLTETSIIVRKHPYTTSL